MFLRLKHLLLPPVFKEEEKNRIALILHVILLTLFTATVLITIAVALFSTGLTTFVLLIALAVMALCYGLLRRGHVRAVSFAILLLLLWMAVAVLAVGFGVHDPAILLLPIIVIVSGLILNTWLFVLFTGLTVSSVGLIILLEVNGYVENAIFTGDSKGLEFAIYATILLVTAVTVYLLTKGLKDNLARARRSESRWKSLLKNAPDIIFYLQPDGTIDFMNTFIDQPHLDTGVIGRTIYDFTHPDYVALVRNTIEKVVQTGEIASYKALGFTQTGQEAWFASRLGPVKQAETIVGLTVISTDITAQREMEMALEMERNFARRIIETMGQGLVIVDENGRFSYVNLAYTQMTGYEMAALVGKPIEAFICEEDVPVLRKHTHARQNGETTTYTLKLPHQDGHIVHAFVTGAPRWQDDTYIGAIVVITDLTEQMEAELERGRLFAELEAQNAELTQFTYTVSHDLKSPLITIRGFLGVLVEDLANGDDAGVQTAVTHIDNAAKTMESLLRDLLELSRVGRVINPLEATPFADIVQEALLLVAGQMDLRDVEIDVADDLPIVSVDRLRVVEVMQNLLDNALKFSQNAQPLRIEIGTTQHHGELCFYVRDNGIGIPARYQEKVFGLFERLDGSTEGTGIGLALAKRIIEVHNGRLWLESAGNGQGTTLYFTLPQPTAKKEAGS